jgi:hypothetical protein
MWYVYALATWVVASCAFGLFIGHVIHVGQDVDRPEHVGAEGWRRR